MDHSTASRNPDWSLGKSVISLYCISVIPESNEDGREGFTREEYQFYLRDRLTAIWEASAASDEIYENCYQAVDWYYTPWPYIEDLAANREAYNKVGYRSIPSRLPEKYSIVLSVA